MKKSLLLFLVSAMTSSLFSQSYDTLRTFVLKNQYAIGVVFDKDSNHYIIATGGAYAVFGDHAFLRLDLNGNQVDSIPQNNNDLLGFRDLTTDGTYIYGSYSKNVIQLDKRTFAALDTFIAPNPICRGLAMEADGTFWESNSNTAEPLTHFDRTGSVLESCPSSSYATEPPYGMAIDTFSNPWKKWMWLASPSPMSPSYNGIHLARYDLANCEVDTVIDLTSKVPGYTGTIQSAGYPAGLHIINDHPSYPGKVVALYVGRRNGGNSYLLVVDITPADVSIGEQHATAAAPHPNPFSDETRIPVPSGCEACSVKLVNAMGQVVRELEQTNAGHIVIERGGLQSGLYFYTISSGGKAVSSGRITVQ